MLRPLTELQRRRWCGTCCASADPRDGHSGPPVLMQGHAGPPRENGGRSRAAADWRYVFSLATYALPLHSTFQHFDATTNVQLLHAGIAAS